MKLFYLSFLLVAASTVSAQTCGVEPGKAAILKIPGGTDDCHFLARATNPAIPCNGTCAECKNNLASNVINVAGSWAGSQIWDPAHPDGLMTWDARICKYTLNLFGLTPNTKYAWKVTQNKAWSNSFGCGNKDCEFVTNSAGAVMLFATPTDNAPVLTYETDFAECGDGICETGESCEFCPQDCGECLVTAKPTAKPTDKPIDKPTDKPTAKPVSQNPVKPCSLEKCPVCNNNLASFVIRAAGSWAGSVIWSAALPNGVMTWDENTCSYFLVVTDLKPKTQFAWKATGNGVWTTNWGCNNGDCQFTSSDVGSIRFVVKPTGNSAVLSTDYNVAECGDGICEPGESCKFCPGDCGECPPPVCGDGVCEGPEETFANCPQDCTNELPHCGIFNDEGCKSGSQFHANEGVGKRRWQTPKPGQKNYQESFQDYHSLVGYGDIRYKSVARTEADVCIIATHRNAGQVTMQYYFNDQPQAEMCKTFTSAHKTEVSLKVVASDGTKLVIPSMTLLWNAEPLARRSGDFRNGQKGAIAEMFGWPHKDIEKECEILSKAGYLGVKLFPIHEQLMSYQPFDNVLNPWYFMYQPVSYKLDGRMGRREELQSLINTCRSQGVRVYNDLVLNHFTGAGNDLLNHRNPNAGCTKWGNKTSSAPIERQSPFYTHAYTYEFNPNTGEAPSNENPGAGIGPEDFHCDRVLGSWSDLFILNNGWLVGLTDLDTSKDNVRERQAAYVVEQISMGFSGFRIDAAKHISPEDISALLGKIQKKMGGQLPDDFFVWLEIITGGEAGMIWHGPSWYNEQFNKALRQDLGSQSEINKIKLWDGLYPKEPHNNPADKHRVVIQNDDHDQQHPGSSSRDMEGEGCVLVKNCPENQHRNFEIKLFENPNGVGDNDNNWPIRFILSSWYHTYGHMGLPDGFSDCSLCTTTCASCKSVPYMPAYEAGACAYKGKGYTRVHRDLSIINAMRKWVKLGPVSGDAIGLPGC